MKPDSPLKRSWRSTCAAVCILVWGAVLVASCSTVTYQPEQASAALFNSPIPEATLQAYRFGGPIQDARTAIIAAHVSLLSTRLRYAQVPQVKSVEQMRLTDARKRVEQPGGYSHEDRPGDTSVWLVMFEGEWQVVPPGHDLTPQPLTHGCVFVMLNASDGGRGEVGGVQCTSR